QTLRLTTIGSVNVKKGARKELRKRRDRLYQKRRRRQQGARPQSESLSRTKPWEAMNMSRRTWERKRNKSRDATSSSAIFLSSDDEPASAELKEGISERGFASKKARGLPSSQTATIIASDIHATLPTELRLLALGLVEADWAKNSARAA